MIQEESIGLEHKVLKSRASWRDIVMVLGVAFVYVVLVRVGLLFTPEASDTSPIWPPAGFSTAVLFLLGLRFWPAIALGSYAGGILFSQLSPLGSIGLMFVNTLEPVVAVVMLQALKFRPDMGRIHDVLVLIASTVFGSTIVSATLGSLLFYVDGQLPLENILSAWFIYWVANATANMTLAPLIFTASSRLGVLGQDLDSRSRVRTYTEIAALIGVLMVAMYLIWLRTDFPVANHLTYLLLPILVYSAVRFGPRVTATCIVLVALGTILATTLGMGPFSHYAVYTGLLMVQVYVLIFALTGLAIASIAEERAAAKVQLGAALESLEHTVHDRTTSLTTTNAMLEAILDNVSSGIIACDSEGRLTLTNRAARETFGVEESLMTSPDWISRFKLFRPNGKTPITSQDAPLLRALRGEVVSNEELAMVGNDDKLQFMLVSGQQISTSKDTPPGAVIAIQDITEQKYHERAQRLLHRAGVIANEAPDEEQAVLSVLDLVCTYMEWPVGHALHVETQKGKRVAISTGWWQGSDSQGISSLSARHQRLKLTDGDHLVGQVLLTEDYAWITDLSNDIDSSRLGATTTRPIMSAVAFPVFARTRMVAILEFFMDRKVSAVPDIVETIKFVCAQLGRFYERAEATQNLMSMTLRDPLTGMPNRIAFIGVLQQAIAHARRRSGYSFSVLFLDLDRFKIINDSLGHASGDEVLLESARRINSCLREGDQMARLGGDEFTVLLDDLGQRSDGANSVKVAQRILEELSNPFHVNGEEVFISCSIGIVISTPEYEDPEIMLQDADSAMYAAKAAGKGRIEIFSHEMHSTAMNLLRLESDLRRALKQNELFLNYQPVVRLSTGEVLGFEALVRWNHPEMGLLSPADFIAIAEETGLIVPLGNYVLREACRWMSGVSRTVPAGASTLSISVNVSGAQFTSGDVAAQVQAALEEFQLSGSQLKLEIVESILMKNPLQAAQVLQPIRDLGVQIFVDDFGTGYSSLSYLAQLPIDALKIDQSFVSSMIDNPVSAEIVRCIIGMAEALDLQVLAEGIETTAQSSALRQLNCTLGQGYLYSRPLDSKGAEELAKAAVIKASRIV